MGGDFGERIDELSAKIGKGSLVGSDKVDQYYAAYVHEILRNRHPTGRAKFLEEPLQANASRYFQAIADHILDGGGTLSMIDAVQAFAEDAEGKTPVEFDILRKSHHLTVTDDGAQVWERPPAAAPISPKLRQAVKNSVNNRPRNRPTA